MNPMKSLLALAFAALIPAGAALASVSAEEAAKLGTTLTPLGAEKAGNAAGTIPAWEGGYTKVPAGFVTGGHYPDPFADDKPLFTIDATNAEQYKDKLAPGQLALFKRYRDWKMKVYPTRRSAAYPAGLYAETKANATKVNLVSGGNGIEGTNGGVPFPIPKDGLEAIWNHLTVYKGDTYATSWAQAPVTATGDYNLVKFDYEYDFVYSNQKKTSAQREDGLLFYFLQTIKEPARLAGSILLVDDFTNAVKTPRKAWTYNPGQRRVRLAPTVAYDNPGTAADGLRTNDDFFMFNGATDRYDWKLIGKKEMYIPYNAYKVNGNSIKVSDVLKVGHINPEPLRYELHRVWVVDANLKAGTSHIYKRRTFYIDEDSWIIHAIDKYDNRDELWRYDELHSYGYYDVPFLAPGVEVKHDLQSGRYIVLSLRNEEKVVYQPLVRTAADFTPDSLRNKGVR
jgi:hypothetical protein